jgi:transposase
MLNGILWILRTGAPWRDLPELFGPWQTMCDYFAGWKKAVVYDRILEALYIRLAADGEIDWDLSGINGSSVRAARAAAEAAKKAAVCTRSARKTML